MAALQKLYEGKKIIVGREKLDVAKGVYNKVRGHWASHEDSPGLIAFLSLAPGIR